MRAIASAAPARDPPPLAASPGYGETELHALIRHGCDFLLDIQMSRLEELRAENEEMRRQIRRTRLTVVNATENPIICRKD